MNILSLSKTTLFSGRLCTYIHRKTVTWLKISGLIKKWMHKKWQLYKCVCRNQK